MKAVLFDLDGVLVDACDWHYEALNRALFELSGISISPEEHKVTFNGLPTRTKLKILEQSGRLAAEQAVNVEQLKQRYTRQIIIERAVPDPQKTQMLSYLAGRGIRLVCVTNAIRETATMMLDRTGQLPFIEFLVTNEDTARHKPDPEPYFQAIRLLGINGSDALIIEDSDKGAASAKASGIPWVQVSGCTEVTKDNVARWLDENTR